MPDFVHLHTHTEFSLLDGLAKCSDLAQHAADLGMSALAITDHGVMYGVVDFYQACKKAGIKPIIGIETYLAHTSRHRKDRSEAKAYHLVLLAQNQTGYKNLLELASLAQLEGFYYKPRIDKEVLAEHSEGVIVLSACVQGEVPQLIHQGQMDKAREAVRWYQAHFPDRFYLELQEHAMPEFDATYRKVIEMAREMDVPLVATNDIHYTRKEESNAHDVLLCIGTGKTVNEPDRMRMNNDSYYMRSPEEMWKIFGDEVPDALENTVKIAEQCEVELQFAPPYHLPNFPVPEDHESSETYLRHLCDEGMVWRYGEDADKPEYVERLEYELGIIHKMGFDDYFLIVWDLCEASRERDIWWNVRGSGAGSVVAYTLGITNVDPFRNRLMFERFLNPSRVNMPDIDLDYPDDRREELIAYTKDRYGADHVSAIITFGTLGARAAIRDVGRALDIPLGEVDRVARMVPNVPGKPVSIQQALETVPELKQFYNETPYIKTLLETAKQVEGVTRHASTHAAGVIVSDKPLTEYLPLNRPTKGDAEESPVDRVSQWPMEIVDEMGMLKVDFLGLRTLTHMRKTCEWIEEEHNVKLDTHTIPYHRVPDDPEKDKKVKKLYDLLATGETTGIFQVEGAGMRRTLRDMRPEQFQHIIAVLALYRPGPMDNIPAYIRRMHGEEEVEYHHPILADILDDTYGIIVYQEQIMQIAVAMADYNPGRADRIRKAVAKKKKKLMNMHQKMFLEGATKKGIAPEVAENVWGDIEFFARYGFNRAHATDYAVITAQTAYLKAHYELEFMTGLMTTEQHNTEKLGTLITDARRHDIEVARPSINRSDVEFTIEHREDPQEGEAKRFIRIGLGAIKNVSDSAMALIMEERKANGPFESLDDFADRVDLRKLNRKTVECLVQAGALDDFGERPALLTVVDQLLAASAKTHQAREVGQFSLFDSFEGMAKQIQPPAFVPPIPDRQMLEWEKELVGTYLSKHPLLDQERELLRDELVNTTIGQISNESPGQTLTALGMIQRVRRIQTKKGDPMAFVTMEGPDGTIDVVVFPRAYKRFRQLLVEDRVLVMNGKLDDNPNRDDHSLLANWFKDPDDLLRPANGFNGSGNGGPPPAYEEPPDLGVRERKPPRYAESKETSPTGTGEKDNPRAQQSEPAEQGTPQPSQSPNGNGHSSNGHNGNGEASVTEDDGETLDLSGLTPQPLTLYITLERSGNNDQDFRTLAQLHNLLQREQGDDPFVVVLEGSGRRKVELSFPNERTRNTPTLRRQIMSLVGQDNLRVRRDARLLL
jgi:DNA polymerase III subunit alpha